MNLEDELAAEDKAAVSDNRSSESAEEAIIRLSKLSAIDYEVLREEEAKGLNFRTSVLDKEVSRARKDADTGNDEVVSSDEPFQGSVNGDALLCEIESLVKKHMILSKGALPAVTLWITATYVYDAFRVFPKLAVISPEKRCGKSTLLDILSGLCNRSLLASNITPSAIFRSVDLWKPCLIIDEADTFLSGRNDDLIGIINSGHTKTTAYVVRTVGDDHVPKKFSTWAPMAFASIGGIVGTVMDRSIIVLLRRRTANEKVQRLTVDFKEDNELIRQKLAKWSKDNFHKLKLNPVEPPEIPNDRAIDNWLPLFTIAYAVGGTWPNKVESSYCTLNSVEEEETAAVMLLRDIKAIFEDTEWTKVHSIDLVYELVKLEERPWSEWKKGKPMTQNSLSKMLKTFEIHSKDMRAGIPEKVKRGFEISQFNDAFLRYIPVRPKDTSLQGATVLQASNGVACKDFRSATEGQAVALSLPLKASNGGGCSTVALQSPVLGEGALNTSIEEDF